ncbi:hypothetical protein F8M41_019467 [Gigaspora margarita]|uniref:Uncharacterized protein n=1 Tax=Gigaspora margarita TaxID=4874 RepID=A0A8H4EKL6_GIGMA|nr:hypothetical protein F8M41_019467 [Gigaspora margarita]
MLIIKIQITKGSISLGYSKVAVPHELLTESIVYLEGPLQEPHEKIILHCPKWGWLLYSPSSSILQTALNSNPIPSSTEQTPSDQEIQDQNNQMDHEFN